MWHVKMRTGGGYMVVDDVGRIRATFSDARIAAANHAIALQHLVMQTGRQPKPRPWEVTDTDIGQDPINPLLNDNDAD